MLSEQACRVAETARVTRWLAAQTAVNAGPACTVWTRSRARSRSSPTEPRPLRSSGASPAGASLATGRGACRHPDGAVRFVSSASGRVRGGVRRPRQPRPLRCLRDAPRTAPAEPAIWPRPREPMSPHLRVNPIACEAHGMCAEVLPERSPSTTGAIRSSTAADRARAARAREPRHACPTFALLLERDIPGHRER